MARCKKGIQIEGGQDASSAQGVTYNGLEPNFALAIANSCVILTKETPVLLRPPFLSCGMRHGLVFCVAAIAL